MVIATFIGRFGRGLLLTMSSLCYTDLRHQQINIRVEVVTNRRGDKIENYYNTGQRVP